MAIMSVIYKYSPREMGVVEESIQALLDTYLKLPEVECIHYKHSSLHKFLIKWFIVGEIG